jgi:hypothetical protein
MRTCILIIAFMFLFLPHSEAHWGGHGNVEEVVLKKESVIPTASSHVVELINQRIELKDIGRLDKSWSTVPESDKKITRQGDGYYIVSFKHPKEERTLFLLMSSMGDLYGVNFSGNFEGVEEEIGN